MKKAKWSEVPPEYRKSRAQKAIEILQAIAMGLCAFISVFSVAVIILVCTLLYTY